MSPFLSSCSFGSLILVAAYAYADDAEQAMLRVTNSSGDRLEVVELRPSLDRELSQDDFHPLKNGQRMSVRFQYTIESVDEAKIFVRPYVDGKRLRKFEAHLSPNYPQGSAKASGYFRLTDESVVDEIQIQMWSAGEQLLVLKLPVRIKGAKPPANVVDPYTTPTFLAINRFLEEQGRLALKGDFAAALANVEKALEAPVPENVHPESWKVHLETSHVQILCFLEMDKAADLAVKYQPSHLQLLQNNLSETDVVIPVLHSQRRMIDSLKSNQPDTALVLIKRLETALEDTSEADGEHIFGELRSARRHIESNLRSIE